MKMPDAPLLTIHFRRDPSSDAVSVWYDVHSDGVEPIDYLEALGITIGVMFVGTMQAYAANVGEEAAAESYEEIWADYLAEATRFITLGRGATPKMIHTDAESSDVVH